MSRRSEESERALIDSRSRRRTPSVEDMVASEGSATFGALTAAPAFTDVPVAAIAAHPDHLRTGVGDLADLTASIREHGVLQPVVLVPLAMFNRSVDTPLVAGRSVGYVTLYGHRRTAAARLAGVTHVPAVIRREYGTHDSELAKMATADISHKGLTPMEEARAFGALLSRAGMSTRKVATMVAVGQNLVVRRVKLLKLPESVQAKIDDPNDPISAYAGECLAGLEDPDLIDRAVALMEDTDAPGRTGADVVALVREQVTQEENAAASMASLTDQGVEPIDPEATWGARATDHIAKDGARHPRVCRAAAITADGMIDWYCTDLPSHPEWAGHLAAEERAASKSLVAAAKARAFDWPGAPAAEQDALDAVLDSLQPSRELSRALEWAIEDGSLGAIEDLARPENVNAALEWACALTGDARRRFVRMVTEARPLVFSRPWGRPEAMRVSRLSARTGYEPPACVRKRIDDWAMQGEDLSCE